MNKLTNIVSKGAKPLEFLEKFDSNTITDSEKREFFYSCNSYDYVTILSKIRHLLKVIKIDKRFFKLVIVGYEPQNLNFNLFFSNGKPIISIIELTKSQAKTQTGFFG